MRAKIYFQGCQINTIEVLLNFNREDLQFMNLHLPENIIERLFDCVDLENQATVESNANSSNFARNIFQNECEEFEDNSKFVYINVSTIFWYVHFVAYKVNIIPYLDCN